MLQVCSANANGRQNHYGLAGFRESNKKKQNNLVK